LGQAPSAGLALRRALQRANCNTEDISHFDFYSCFPIAVSNAIDAIGLSADDPRGLTVTGGLPFFGGPGNSYSMHALAEMVTCLRMNPGKFGLVAANGGLLSKYAVGIYATTPVAYEPYDSADLQEEMSRQIAPHFEKSPSGEGSLEAYTVADDRDGQPKTATIIGRLSESDARFIAKVGREAPAILEVFSSSEPEKRSVLVTPSEQGNSFIFL
jgi:acetyl-CoA C-acetyltransferase